MTAHHSPDLTASVLARLHDTKRAGAIWQWAIHLRVGLAVDEAHFGIDSMIDDAIADRRVDRLLLELMRVARDVVPSLRGGVLIDQFHAEANSELDAARRAGQTTAAYPYLNHVDRVRAAKLWAGYLTADQDDAEKLVGHGLDVAELVGRDVWSVHALIDTATRLVPQLRTPEYAEAFVAVSRRAALDEANWLAGPDVVS